MGLGVRAVSVGVRSPASRLHLTASSPSRPREFHHVCTKCPTPLPQPGRMRADPSRSAAAGGKAATCLAVTDMQTIGKFGATEQARRWRRLTCLTNTYSQATGLVKTCSF